MKFILSTLVLASLGFSQLIFADEIGDRERDALLRVAEENHANQAEYNELQTQIEERERQRAEQRDKNNKLLKNMTLQNHVNHSQGIRMCIKLGYERAFCKELVRTLSQSIKDGKLKDKSVNKSALISALSTNYDFEAFGRDIYQAALKNAVSMKKDGKDFSKGKTDVGLRVVVDMSQNKVGRTGEWIMVVGKDGVVRTILK